MTLPRIIMKFYTNFSCSNLTPVPPEFLIRIHYQKPYPGFTSPRMQFYADSSSETLPRFYFFQDAVSHELAISNPTQVPSPTPDVASHELIINKPYTGFLQFQDAVLHGLVISNPTQVPSFNLRKEQFKTSPGESNSVPQKSWNSSP